MIQKVVILRIIVLYLSKAGSSLLVFDNVLLVIALYVVHES